MVNASPTDPAIHADRRAQADLSAPEDTDLSALMHHDNLATALALLTLALAWTWVAVFIASR